MMAFMDRESATDGREASTGRPLLWATLLSLVAVMTAGLATGLATAMLERKDEGFSALATGLLALAVVASIATAWQAWRFYRRATGGPMAKSERRSLSVMSLAAPLGMFAGFAAVLTGGDASLFGAGPIPAATAVILSLAALGAVAISIYWVRSIDEHERRAHLLGAEAGIFAFMTLAPVWWFCARAGLLPPVDPLGLYLVTTLPYILVWLRHRYFG